MSEQDEERALDDALKALPAEDVSEWARARIKRRALEELARAGGPRWFRALERIYTFGLEPALVFGVAPLYLVWAVSTLVGIYGIGPR